MFQTRCSRGVEIPSSQKLVRKSRDSREKQGMYSEEKGVTGSIQERKCSRLRIVGRSVQEALLTSALLPLCSSGVTFWECHQLSLGLMQCSCCHMGSCSSCGLPTYNFSNSVPIFIHIIQGIISPETLQVNMFVIFAYDNNPFLSAQGSNYFTVRKTKTQPCKIFSLVA